MRKSGDICFPNFLKFWDTESVFPGFEGLLNTMICTIKFVIQRFRNELKVGGAEHTSAEGATYVGRSGVILPLENFEN